MNSRASQNTLTAAIGTVRYHGVDGVPDGVPEGASYLYFIDDEPKAQRFEHYLEQHPGAVDIWLGGHTGTFPDDVA